MRLEAEPTIVNSSPYEDGWLFKIRLSADVDDGHLVDYETYQKTTLSNRAND